MGACILWYSVALRRLSVLVPDPLFAVHCVGQTQGWHSAGVKATSLENSLPGTALGESYLGLSTSNAGAIAVLLLANSFQLGFESDRSIVYPGGGIKVRSAAVTNCYTQLDHDDPSIGIPEGGHVDVQTSRGGTISVIDSQKIRMQAMLSSLALTLLSDEELTLRVHQGSVVNLYEVPGNFVRIDAPNTVRLTAVLPNSVSLQGPIALLWVFSVPTPQTRRPSADWTCAACGARAPANAILATFSGRSVGLPAIGRAPGLLCQSFNGEPS